MSGSVNKVILLGNLVADPEVKSLQNGGMIVNIRLATNERWRDKTTGEKKQRAEFHRVVIFNEGIAKVAEQYLKKGSQVYLEGQIQTRKWTDQQGVERYSTEIVLNAFRSALVLIGGNNGGGGESGEDRQSATARRSTREELDDDIPF